MQNMEAYLDSSTFIFALEISDSNSAKILEALIDKRFNGYITQKVLDEVRTYLISRRNRQYVFLIETLIRKNTIFIRDDEIQDYIVKWGGKIKEKDLIHISAVKKLGLKYLVALDRDFEDFLEYTKPKEFIKLLGEKAVPTEY